MLYRTIHHIDRQYLLEVCLQLSELEQVLQMFQAHVGPLHQDVGLLLHTVVQAGHRVHRIAGSQHEAAMV